MQALVEYIWLDGSLPSQQLRSKTRVIEYTESYSLDDLPDWSFDGSSTGQAQGGDSDLILKPVCLVKDPIRQKNNSLVLCEVWDAEKPHTSNSRAPLRELLDKVKKELEPKVGFEQEFTFLKSGEPLAWLSNPQPQKQGSYYCGVGSGKVFGRELAEAITQACIDAGLQVFGANAEVLPGQWEVQIGYRGFSMDDAELLVSVDHLILFRWLAARIAEQFEISVSFDNKPVKGNWNGSGCHTNFSTSDTRNPEEGLKAVKRYISLLEKQHSQHITFYGHGLAERLTGEFETCSINEFKSGIADRAASIRIPRQVQQKGYGYLEDRRPGANCDPYVVLEKILSTVAQDSALLAAEA